MVLVNLTTPQQIMYVFVYVYVYLRIIGSDVAMLCKRTYQGTRVRMFYYIQEQFPQRNRCVLR
jgi:hypothetical protein